MNDLHLRVVLSSPAGDLEPRRVLLLEGTSFLTEATVELALDASANLDALLDADVEIRWTRGDEQLRCHVLRVAEVRYGGVVKGAYRYVLDLRAPLWFLRFSTDIRKFRDVTARDIVGTVLGEAGLAHVWQLTREPASRPWCVQYRETKLDFVLRLLEAEGIHYVMLDDGTIALRDASNASPPVPGTSSFRLIESGGALHHAAEGVTAFGRGCRVGSGRATVNDHDWKRPSLSLLASASGARDAALEVYDYPVGVRDPGEAAAVAQRRVEAYEASKRFVFGASSVLGFGAGRLFEFSHDDGLSHDGSFVLTRVEHEYVWEVESGDVRYANRFEAIPAATPFRPPLETPRPAVGGCHTATVRGPVGEEIHTDVHGRCKVQFHWDRAAKGTDEDSRWLRLLQETSSSLQLARVGWEVQVSYVAGDPDRPIATSRLINGQMVPSYKQPAEQNVFTIKTESYPGKLGLNEIKVDDTAGAERIDIRAERDIYSEVLHDQREVIARDEAHEVAEGLSLRVDKSQKVVIGSDDTMTAGKSERLTVSRDRTTRIGGSEKVKVDASVTEGVKGNDAERVGALRASLVGGFKPPDLKSLIPNPAAAARQLAEDRKAKVVSALKSGGPAAAAGAAKAALSPKGLTDQLKGAIPTPKSIAAKLDPRSMISGTIARRSETLILRTIGAAHLALAGGPIGNRGGKLLAELVGGLKLVSASKDAVIQNTRKQLVRTVGGMWLMKAGTDATVSSKTTVVTIGGGARIDAVEKIDLKGETLRLEAKEKLSLLVGDLVIELTPEGIRMVGITKLDAKDKITVHGTPDNLTQ